MQRSILVLLIAAAILVLGGFGCKRTVPIQAYGMATLAPYGYLTPEQIRDGILRGGQKVKWSMVEERPGLVVGTLVVRNKHTVIVEIPYSVYSYAIRYRSSINMKTRDGEIHRSYATWVEELNNSISAELGAINKR